MMTAAEEQVLPGGVV